MTQLGRRLPRAKVAAKLYPTGQMRTAVEGLYAGMVTFLLKTHEWLHEPKWKRAYHNITRPPALQYGDVLEQIEGCSKDIIEIATLSSHKDLRAMHTFQNEQLYQIIKRLEAADHDRGAQIRGLRHLLSSLGHSQSELQGKIDLVLSVLQVAGISIQDLLVKADTYHSIQMNAHLNTNDRLTDLQLAQTLASLSSSFHDPHKCFQRHLLLRKRRAAGIATVASTNEFWRSPTLKSFSLNHDSDMVIVKGTFNLRAAIRDFGVDAIRALTRSEITTVWALEGADREKSRWNSADFLRYLTWQVLRNSKLTEKQMSVRYSQFQTVQTPMEWMRLFREVVKRVDGQLYLIVDLAVMQASLATVDGFNIINELNELIRSSAQERNFVLKTIVLTYDTDWNRMLPSALDSSIIAVKKATSRKLPRKQNRNLRFSKA
ncbi:hypothetical protein E8E14_009421 [Neopestalotiopsis sp. 37M]|nr:hypothetical protein E8E14_009421 [Neopestalotiopsis sp. 37M]